MTTKDLKAGIENIISAFPSSGSISEVNAQELKGKLVELANSIENEPAAKEEEKL